MDRDSPNDGDDDPGGDEDSQSPDYVFDLEQPVAEYSGHTVALTDSQRLKVLRSIVGEQEVGTYEIYVGLSQTIRDYVDYGSLARSYDNLGTFWLCRGGPRTGRCAGTGSRSDISFKDYDWFVRNKPEAVRAVEYVFDHGGSLGQGVMHYYVDDDDAYFDGGYWPAYYYVGSVSCGGGHYHNKIKLAPDEYPSNWMEFELGAFLR